MTVIVLLVPINHEHRDPGHVRVCVCVRPILSSFMTNHPNNESLVILYVT